MEQPGSYPGVDRIISGKSGGDQLSLWERDLEQAGCTLAEAEKPEAVDLRPQGSGKRRLVASAEGNRALAPVVQRAVSSATERYHLQGRTAGYGPVRPVVWEDGGREPPSYPISGGSSNTTAAIAAAISSRSSRPPSRTP